MKILIFYTKTGGGHQSAAKNLANHLTCEYELIDLGEKNSWTRFIYSDLYVILTERLFPIWALCTLIWRTRTGRYLTKKFFDLEFRNYIKSYIQESKPTIVVSTYFFASSIARSIQPDLKAFYLVSEIFGAPKIWFDDKQAQYLVASKEIANLGISLGIPNSNIHQFNKFYTPQKNINTTSQAPIAKQSNRTIDGPTSIPNILIIGGGASLPNGVKLIKVLKSSNLQLTFTVITGRNTEMFNALTRLTNGDRRFTIKGFVDNVPELLTESSLVICKAGPGVIMEIINSKKPMLIYHYIWEQEKPNLDYVLQHNLGSYCPNLKLIPQEINSILYSNKKYNTIDLEPNSIIEIAKFVENSTGKI